MKDGATFLAFICLAATCKSVWCSCDYALGLDANQSSFKIMGEANSTYVNGLEIQLKEKHEAVALLGNVVLASGNSCVLNSERGADMIMDSELSSGKVHLFPRTVETVVAEGVAFLDFSDVEMELWSDRFLVNEDGTGEGDFTLQIVSGTVFYALPMSLGLSLQPGTWDLAGMRSSGRTSMKVDIQDSQITIQVQNASFVFKASFETSWDLSPVIDFAIGMHGDIVAKGKIV